MREVDRYEETAPLYPGISFHWLTRWYDPMMRRFFPEEC